MKYQWTTVSSCGPEAQFEIVYNDVAKHNQVTRERKVRYWVKETWYGHGIIILLFLFLTLLHRSVQAT